MAKRILVVDDEESIQELMSSMLAERGYETVRAMDGEEGLKMAKSENPDLIILDINMPKMSGCGISMLLSKNEKTKHIPVIFLTGYIAKEEAEDLDHKLAGNQIVTKPFGTDELWKAIDNVLPA